jgi:hypothetical protein
MIDQRLAPWATLLLRVSLGLLFIAHLYWKFVILDGGLDKWWANFAANGYPSITPWYCISAEFAGALLLIPGIWTRWVALYALPLILGRPKRILLHDRRRRDVAHVGAHAGLAGAAWRWPLCGCSESDATRSHI